MYLSQKWRARRLVLESGKDGDLESDLESLLEHLFLVCFLICAVKSHVESLFEMLLALFVGQWCTALKWNHNFKVKSTVWSWTDKEIVSSLCKTMGEQSYCPSEENMTVGRHQLLKDDLKKAAISASDISESFDNFPYYLRYALTFQPLFLLYQYIMHFFMLQFLSNIIMYEFATSHFFC